jgi:hypothetical protein
MHADLTDLNSTTCMRPQKDPWKIIGDLCFETISRCAACASSNALEDLSLGVLNRPTPAEHVLKYIRNDLGYGRVFILACGRVLLRHLKALS